MIGHIVSNAMDALVLVVLFGVTILVHELGHFLVALRCGMVVDTFSIGFGPAIWKRKIRGIVYKIGCIPFGGYVTLPQLDPAGMELIQGEGGKPAEPRGGRSHDAAAARNLPPIESWKKILVTVAGPVGNIILGIILAWVVYLGPEVSDREGGATVGMVETNSLAFVAGVRAGDEIVAVNGKPVTTWYDYNVECTLQAGEAREVTLAVRSATGTRDLLLPLAENEMGAQSVAGISKAIPCLLGEVVAGGSGARAGLRPGDLVTEFNGVRVVGWDQFRELVDTVRDQPAPIVVQRGGERVALTVTPALDPEMNRAIIGVKLGMRPTMPWMMSRRPWAQIKGDAMGIVRILRALVTPRESRQAAGALGGPIMILTALWVSIKISIMNAVGFLRFLNVNLAILNLLPIPVLDGGHIVFAAWEGITRRRIHPRFVNILVNVFATILIAIMLVISYRDIRRIFPGVFRVFDRSAPAEVEPATTNAPPAP